MHDYQQSENYSTQNPDSDKYNFKHQQKISQSHPVHPLILDNSHSSEVQAIIIERRWTQMEGDNFVFHESGKRYISLSAPKSILSFVSSS